MRYLSWYAIVLFSWSGKVFARNLHTSDQYKEKFEEWTTTYGLTFPNDNEYVKRLQIFSDTSDMIELHNSKKNSYRLAHNAFSHLTVDEFANLMLSGSPKSRKLGVNPRENHGAAKNFSIAPLSWDWVSLGAVTDVKDQGKCSSGGWAFSTTGAIEGAYQIKTKNLVTLSDQQLLSCDNTDSGCDGGWADSAFTWTTSNGGLCLEADYLLTSNSTGTSDTCVTTCEVVAGSKPTTYVDVTTGSVSALVSAVYQQPVSVFIQANQRDIKQYSSGVFTGVCGQRLDHGVLAVGYGSDVDSGIDYWNIKNSWGTAWGENGYIRIEKSDTDRCGVLDSPSYPTL